MDVLKSAFTRPALRRFIRRALLIRGLLLSAMLALPVTAFAAEGVACKVHDPELQGVYRGPCVDGWAHGAGEAEGPAARYIGDFVRGRKHGQGVKTWVRGDRYEGGFRDDRRHGEGRYVWGPRSEWAGQSYAGGYVDDLREGTGTYHWPDGRSVRGLWRRDLPATPVAAQMAQSLRSHAERHVRVMFVGATVCRVEAVGIAAADTFKGRVERIDGERITVRITTPGRLGGQLDGKPVAKDQAVTDYPDRWAPCR